jgi:FtsZ-interacting cell division protein YlmF
MKMSRQFENLIKLGLSEVEAQEVLEADKRIDKGEKLFELSADQKKAEKQARQADRAPTVYNFTPRERKKDAEKHFLLSCVQMGLEQFAKVNNIQVVNNEREIVFNYENKKYKIVLSAPRN